MSFMERMERQWAERQLGLEQVTVSVSACFTADAGRVWEFLMAPESAYLGDPAVVNAFRVPGTPVGEVGEQHCFVRDEGEGRRSVVLSEVVELEPRVRVVVRFPTYSTTCTTTQELRPDGTDVTLSHRMDVMVERGQRRRVTPILQAEMQAQLDRIVAAIRSGMTLPGTEGH